MSQCSKRNEIMLRITNARDRKQQTKKNLVNLTIAWYLHVACSMLYAHEHNEKCTKVPSTVYKSFAFLLNRVSRYYSSWNLKRGKRFSETKWNTIYSSICRVHNALVGKIEQVKTTRRKSSKRIRWKQHTKTQRSSHLE